MIIDRVAMRYPGGSWTHLPPFFLQRRVKPRIKFVPVQIAQGRERIKENRIVGLEIEIDALYIQPTRQAGLQWQRVICAALHNTNGRARTNMDICLRVDTGGTLTDIYRGCEALEPFELEDGNFDRWRRFRLRFFTADLGPWPSAYASGTGGGVPGSGPYEIWIGGGQTASRTGQRGTTSSTSSTTITVADGSGFVEGDKYLIGSEIVQIDDVTGNTLTVTRGINGTIKEAWSGEPISSFVSDPATEGYVMGRDSFNISLPGMVETVTDANSADRMQRVRQWQGTRARLVAVQATGIPGTGGSPTVIHIGNHAWDAAGDHLAITLQPTSSASAVVTGAIAFETGDNIYAYVDDGSGQHVNVDLALTFEF